MPPENKPATKGERIAKVIAAAGLCSRREAEQWIAEGRVTVDGKVLTTPACVVTESNVITVNGHPLRRRRMTRLWIYHKPTGQLVTNSDPQGRPTIYDFLPKSMPRTVSVGRLDFNSEGLLLLTNDGGLARYLELPKNAARRVYRVRIYGNIPAHMIEDLARGITVEGVTYAPLTAEIDKVTGRNAWLYMTLTEGKNREIRKLMEHFGLQVNRLIRHSYGPFELGNLSPGKVIEVPFAALTAKLPEYFGNAAASASLPENKKSMPRKSGSQFRLHKPGKKPAVKRRKNNNHANHNRKI